MRKRTLADAIREKAAARNGAGAARPQDPPRASPEPKPPPSPVETFNAADLMAMQLQEPRWAVEGVVPEGLSVLAGKPKLGKSWLVLHMALAVSAGGIALGKIEVEGGAVLYISLEDTKRRLQSRIRKLLGPGEQPSARLHLAHDWPRLDRGGGDAIAEWIETHPDARLIAIDTWGRFRPVRLGKADGYDIDYADGAIIKAIADKYGVSIVIVHHCRKLAAADAVEEVAGSVGLTGACDGVLVMRRERGQHDATLMVTGRDVDEAELALSFTKDHCLWQLMGEAEDYRMSKERSEILSLFADGKNLSPSQVEALTGRRGDAVRRLLSRMARDGQLLTTERGRYCLPSQPDREEEPPNPFIDDDA